MKKLIRGYFLAFAEESGIKNLLIFTVLLVVDLILLIWHGNITEDNLNQKASPVLIITFAIPILNQILVSVVKKIFISMPPKFESRMDSAFIQTEKGEKIIFKKPVWSKGTIYKLLTTDKRSSWERYSHDEAGRKILTVQTEISGRWKNSTVKIPVEIKIYTEKDFDPVEVFEKAQIKPNPQEICLPEYLRQVFDIVNERNQAEIQKLITEYVEMKISESVLISEAIELLIFPERPFSNVENVQICLGDPTTSSCKGMVCGK